MGIFSEHYPYLGYSIRSDGSRLKASVSKSFYCG